MVGGRGGCDRLAMLWVETLRMCTYVASGLDGCCGGWVGGELLCRPLKEMLPFDYLEIEWKATVAFLQGSDGKGD